MGTADTKTTELVELARQLTSRIRNTNPLFNQLRCDDQDEIIAGWLSAALEKCANEARLEEHNALCDDCTVDGRCERGAEMERACGKS